MTETIGEVIKRERKRRTLSQRELGQMLGKTESAVRMWELGKNTPPAFELERLAEIFELNPLYLMRLAGHISSEEVEKIYGYTASRFTTVLHRLISDIRPFLIEMEQEGAFLHTPDYASKSARKAAELLSDGTIEKYAGSVVKRVYEQKGELENMAHSEYVGLYDGVLQGVFAAESVSRHIQENALDPIAELNDERDRLKLDLEHLHQNITTEVIKADSFFELLQPKPDKYIFRWKLPNGDVKQLDNKTFALNDLASHLTDSMNSKFYKDIILTKRDREAIAGMIDAYLLHQYINDEQKDRDKLIDSLTEETTIKMYWEEQKEKMREAGQRRRDKEEEKPNGQD